MNAFACESRRIYFVICIMLDDTRCGLGASSLHRATSMDNYKVEKFGLLSCHRDTSNIARYKAKEKLEKYEISQAP